MANTTSGTVTFDKTFAVDEIIAELDSERVFERIYFWNEVKQEIKLIGK